MAAIGIIGGSGFYQIKDLEEAKEILVETPFGPPSEAILSGRIAGREVFFLPRHGKGHRILPTELNHRANIWAMRSLGVRWIISVTAVGSLQPQYKPRDIVLPDQFYDRSSRREHHTFFGEGIVAHVSFAEPISAQLRKILRQTVTDQGLAVHDGATYVQMDGPAFSTRAESETNRRLGFDLIGMTNLPEAKLAREAEIALATLAMVTDYDCWKQDEEEVSVEMLLGHLRANAGNAETVVAEAVKRIPRQPDWPEHKSLDNALVTDRTLWPEQTYRQLEPILSRFCGGR